MINRTMDEKMNVGGKIGRGEKQSMSALYVARLVRRQN